MADRPAQEFCPHGGLHNPDAESPATFAGRADGHGPARLKVAALAVLALFGLYALHAAISGALDAITLAITAVVGLASLGVAWLAWARPERAPLAGGPYLLGTALAVALVEQHLGADVGGFRWSAIAVAFFPLVLPSAPRRTLGKALVAASMTPLALGIAVALGRAVPAPLDVVALVVPVYVAAFVAYGGAKVLARLGGKMEAMAAIGRYALVGKLGEGGMGDVWEARHRLLARPVALKLVKRSDDDPMQLARFSREARITASLESPHTVRLYDFGATEDGRLFYAMELLEGLDLEELVRRHGPLPPERVVHVLLQALRSLEEAHARGLVHRDIKPANLHLGRYALAHDHLKVLDFGLAKDTSGAHGLIVTGEGRISGTPAYMAPEMVTGRPVDGRADVYALGSVAVFLLTGERVFPEAHEPLAAAVAHVTERPASIRARGVRLSDELEELLMSTLEKDPTRRPTAAALRERLEAVALERWTERDAAAWWARHAPLPPARTSEPPETAPTVIALPAREIPSASGWLEAS